MSLKKVIPCLDLCNGRVVKGVNFVELHDVGDPAEIARRYCEAGADEIVFLDITATHEQRGTMIDIIERAARFVTIPLCVGGGIRTLKDIELALEAGATKVSIGSAAYRDPNLITVAAKQFGKERIVVAIDTFTHADQRTTVFINGGRLDTECDAVKWARQCEACGAGGLLITSMNCDGVKEGFDIPTLAAVKQSVSIPVTASGGAGKLAHFVDAVKLADVDAVLAASLFHFGDVTIAAVKDALRIAGFEVSKR